MNYIKKILVALATMALPLWLLLLATTGSVVLTFHSPAKIKSWVNDSGAYNNVVDAVLAESQKSAKESGDSLPIQNTGVQEAAKKSFSPAVLQKDTENVIDGMYHWLQGKTPQPDFKIDLSGPKKQFASNIGDYLRDRTKALPACARGQVPETTDIFAINCVPPGLDINKEIQQNVDKLAGSKDFLEDPVITASSLKSDNNQPTFDKFKTLPKVYQKATWSPLLLGGFALLGVAVIIFLHDERRKGMKRVARITLPTGVLLIFVAIAIQQITKRVIDQVHLDGAGAAKLQPAVVSMINSVSGALSHAYLWFGIGYVLVGVGLLLAVKLWFTPPKPAEAEKPAKPDKKPGKPTSPKQPNI